MSDTRCNHLAALVPAVLAAVLAPTAAAAAPATAPHQSTATAPAERCGGSRFTVKTGSDPDAGRVDLRSVTPTTIAALTARPAPRTLPGNNRIPPVETTVYRVTATLDRYALVPADSDYHLILRDNAGHTMITEIPDPSCVGTASPFKALVGRARAKFDARYTPSATLAGANVPVTVTGVGFFDSLHGQAGVAPNGVELHPVLDVRFGTAAGAAAPPATR